MTLRVQSDTGESEIVHLEAAGLGSRRNLSPDIIQAGDYVKVGVRAPRIGTRYEFRNVLLRDGTELLMRGVYEPRWSDRVIFRTGTPVSEAAAAAAGDRAEELFGVWIGGAPNIAWSEELPLTDAARAAQTAFDMEADEYPLLRCVAPGMPRAVIGNLWPIELQDHGSEILFRMQEFDIVRTIHMEPVPDVEEISATPLGYSVGRWEYDTLVVETSRIDWPYFDNTGIPQSPAIEITERFSLGNDGTELHYEITVTEPLAFTRPVHGVKRWRWVPGRELIPYDCAPDE
jgi:hypothetical protein